VDVPTLDDSVAESSGALEANVQSHHDTTEAYQHRKLADTEIRLLKFEHTSVSSSPLKATLQHVPLLSARAMGYIALSYTWGDLSATSDLVVDGKRLKIRPNLARILRKLRTLRYDYICVSPSTCPRLVY
jgi:hypothetical protein